ncbi:hypothetical protein RFM26_16495 [Mesorhizobium sp. VK23B]|uniref:Uncharacterized protein n=1 Tax=Mesorhizobium dulcispinae TaxID=3072316 RepID=A0ABU4XGR8_9HYPH|nr:MULTISPECIES: hypothetical protein [unclassified Mesorhizobium]MDX8467294.1 hypothetical protein [Mesorhizobium sp. VK23B]MDX8473718.1 hypothetical protein [Mesorhizobium sp. VK23A]MDX8518592.1 hypothetical protein [Mesorhizobium sp. VK23D]
MTGPGILGTVIVLEATTLVAAPRQNEAKSVPVEDDLSAGGFLPKSSR